jgi:cytoskeletal protein RodZ
MALFKRDEPTNVIPAAGSQVEVKSSGRPGWLILLAALVAVLIISTGLVFAGRWVYRSVHHKSAQPPVSQPVSTNKTAYPKRPSGSGTQNTPQPSPTTQPSPSASNNQTGSLPQNGPGNVVALFVGTALTAAGLHYLVNLRRQPN